MIAIDLNKYKNSKPIIKLQSGEDVVGTETDANNRLIYIIRRNGKLISSYATEESASPVTPIVINQPVTVPLKK